MAAHQDWNDVVFKKKKPAPKAANGIVTVGKRLNAGKNVHTPLSVSQVQKVANSDEIQPIKTVGSEFGKRLVKARVAKEMSQKDLALKVSERVKVIQDYESGKAIPNQLLIDKLEKVLNAKLRK